MPSGTLSSVITLSRLSPSLEREIKTVLTFKNPAYVDAVRFSPYGYVSPKIPKSVKLYKEDRGRLIIPRGFAPSDLSDESERRFRKISIEDHRSEAPVSFPDPIKPPNSEQKFLVRAFKEAVKARKRPSGSFSFASPTGTGKSFAQALIARETGQRTLILCVTNIIRDGWYRELQEFFGIPRKEVGIIQQSKYKIGEVFTLASVSTLVKHRHRWKELFELYGCIIMDECHTASAPGIQEFFWNCPAKYIIGMSATPEREKFGFYSRAIFGKPVKRLFLNSSQTHSSLPLSKVHTVKTDFDYSYPEGALNWNDLSETLTLDEDRNALIVSKARDDWEAGESVLVATPRLAHVSILVEMLREAGVVDANALTGSTNANNTYRKALWESVVNGKVRCVVACTNALILGANYNALSRLHLAMPIPSKVRLEQLIGRIRRKTPEKATCEMTYYLDIKVPYLFRVYKLKAAAVFRKLRVPQFRDLYIA